MEIESPANRARVAERLGDPLDNLMNDIRASGYRFRRTPFEQRLATVAPRILNRWVVENYARDRL